MVSTYPVVYFQNKLKDNIKTFRRAKQRWQQATSPKYLNITELPKTDMILQILVSPTYKVIYDHIN